MLEELQSRFHSMLKSLDVFYVLKELKDVSRIIVKDVELDEVLSLLKGYGLEYSVSDFKIKSKSEEDKGFTNKGLKLEKNSTEKGNFFIYISKDQEKCDNAKKFEDCEDHLSLGKLLGYPSCCSKFFNDNFNLEKTRYNDYILRALKNSNDFKFPFHNNFAIRNFDLALISHFPCDFNCESSRKIGVKNLEVVKNDSSEIGMILEDMLKGSVIYTEDKGVFFLRGNKIKDKKLFYGTVMSSVNNKLSDLIKQSVFIEIEGKDRVLIKGKELSGEYGFLSFI